MFKYRNIVLTLVRILFTQNAPCVFVTHGSNMREREEWNEIQTSTNTHIYPLLTWRLHFTLFLLLLVWEIQSYVFFFSEKSFALHVLAMFFFDEIYWMKLQSTFRAFDRNWNYTNTYADVTQLAIYLFIFFPPRRKVCSRFQWMDGNKIGELLSEKKIKCLKIREKKIGIRTVKQKKCTDHLNHRTMKWNVVQSVFTYRVGINALHDFERLNARTPIIHA